MSSEAHASLMNEILMRVVVQAAAFFELCDDDVLDPDIAVKQLEWVSSELQRLDPEAKEALIAFAQAEAEATDDPSYRAFPFALPDGLGLLDAG